MKSIDSLAAIIELEPSDTFVRFRLRPSVAVVACLVSGALLTSAPARADGLLGGLVKHVGNSLGVPAVTKLGTEMDNGMNDAKQALPILKVVEEGSSRVVRESAKYVDEHRQEALLTVIVIAEVAIACADGCSFGVGALVAAGGGGANLVIFDSDKKHPDSFAGRSDPYVPAPTTTTVPTIPPTKPMSTASQKPEPTSPIATQTREFKAPAGASYARSKVDPHHFPNMRSERVFPQAYSMAQNPGGSPYKVVYVPPGAVNLNKFAHPTKRWHAGLPALDGRQGDVRLPAPYDWAGGILSSRRNDHLPKQQVAMYGVRTRRVHGGIDFLASPREAVYAAMTGAVTKYEEAVTRGNAKMGILTIQALDGTVARTLYVQPMERFRNVPEGGIPIRAGEQIGNAQDLSTLGYGQNEPNHVHQDFIDASNRKFDPFNGGIVERDPRSGHGPQGTAHVPPPPLP